MPNAAISDPRARPTASGRAGSRAAPTDSMSGHSVSGLRKLCTRPPSCSTDTTSGISRGAAPRREPTSSATWGGETMFGSNSVTPPISTTCAVRPAGDGSSARPSSASANASP
jgi:hypothetical protein